MMVLKDQAKKKKFKVKCLFSLKCDNVLLYCFTLYQVTTQSFKILNACKLRFLTFIFKRKVTFYYY